MRHWVSGCCAAVELLAAVPIHAQSQWTLRRGAPDGAEVVEIDLMPIAAVAFQVVAVIGILVFAYLLFRGITSRRNVHGPSE